MVTETAADGGTTPEIRLPSWPAGLVCPKPVDLLVRASASTEPRL